ncbi:hypothetical protein PV04_09032 [Phialophora macrospora]|uniref:Zn(2)-C6 fungal-type domain-containing protein n=1 Tax=Phialophora macrospora TaxID=1851006 RepID=A0A0D2FVP3_9EURO|nr:hypothetical protein PV04_09032 [Phialophora macrospora]
MPRRACDACKIRKVKCDGDESSDPCSNCRMSKLTCEYKQQVRKRGRRPLSQSQLGPRRRVSRDAQLSDQYTDSNSHTSPTLSIYEVDLAATVPYQDHTTPKSISGRSGVDINAQIQILHDELVSSLLLYAPSLTLDVIVSGCIDIALRDVFPLGPLFHEPSIRQNVPLRRPVLRTDSIFWSSHGTGLVRLGNNQAMDDLARLRAYTATTALCASVSFLLPAERVTNVVMVGQAFLQTTREILKLYEDFDVVNPDSSSLVIRLCQASALHTCARTLVAWQRLDEALRLAEQMRLYDERSYEGLPPLEAQMRRLAFWQLYILDKYASLVEGTPMRMHSFSIGAPITTKIRGEIETPLLVSHVQGECSDLEKQLLAGFYLLQSMWAAAADVSLDLQILGRLCRPGAHTRIAEEANRMNLAETYLRFIAVLDDFPPSLESLEPPSTATDEWTVSSRRSFWLQRSHLLVSYHTLRMIFLQRFADLGLADLVGSRNDRSTLASRKMEIAHDFIIVITSVPFDCLRANGESCVAKIRKVGATLLEVILQVETPQIVSRAKALFPRLMDVLTRLDSRASDELNSEYLH